LSGSSECKVCASNGFPGVVINWDDTVRSKKTGKKIPLDASGAYHKHRDVVLVEQDENQTPIVRGEALPPMGTPPPSEISKYIPRVEFPTATQDQRSKDIAAAHDENMQASENLVTAINNLAGEAATLTTALGDFRDFVGKIVHELIIHPKDREAIGLSESDEYHRHNNEDASA
jgi:hypothetical protein